MIAIDFRRLLKAKKRLARVSARLVGSGLAEAIASATRDLIDRERAFRRLLDRLPPEEQAILRLRYLRGKKWHEVASTMFYSLRWVHELHKRAIERLSQLGKNKEDDQ